MQKEEVKEIAYIAWKAASNAHRLYPDNKHTFTEYWRSSKKQFDKYLKSDFKDQVIAYQQWCHQHSEYDELCESDTIDLYLKATKAGLK